MGGGDETRIMFPPVTRITGRRCSSRSRSCGGPPLDYTADDFQKIVEPTLVLLGDRDGIVELQQAVDEYQLIPNAELFIIPNATHFTAESELSMPIVLTSFIRNRG